MIAKFTLFRENIYFQGKATDIDFFYQSELCVSGKRAYPRFKHEQFCALFIVLWIEKTERLNGRQTVNSSINAFQEKDI